MGDTLVASRACYGKLRIGIGRFADVYVFYVFLARLHYSFFFFFVKLLCIFGTSLYIIFLSFTIGNYDFCVSLRFLFRNGTGASLSDFLCIYPFIYWSSSLVMLQPYGIFHVCAHWFFLYGCACFPCLGLFPSLSGLVSYSLFLLLPL